MPIAAIPLPIAIDDLAKRTKAIGKAHGEGCTFREVGAHLVIYTPGEFCEGCIRCDEFEREAIGRLTDDPLRGALGRVMVLCPTCGNKRCPRATDHDYECSGSNEPGQLGSVY